MKSKKSVCLTLKQKAEILKCLDSGLTGRYVAKQFNVAPSTVCSILAKRKKILDSLSVKYDVQADRRTLRGSKLPKMEKALYAWYIQMQKDEEIVSNKLLKLKAMQLHSIYKEEQRPFYASDGWVQRFKSRYNIPCKSEEKTPLRPIQLMELCQKENEVDMKLDGEESECNEQICYFYPNELDKLGNNDESSNAMESLADVSLGSDTENDDTDSDKDTLEAAKQLKASDAFEYLQKIIRWSSRLEGVQQEDINALKRLKKKALLQLMDEQ